MSKRNLPAAEIASRSGLRTDLSPKAFDRWNPDLRAAADDQASEPTISILDVIGQDWFGEGVTSKRIAAALRGIGDRDVTVTINSPGGDYFEGLAIYNLLRDHPAKVTVKIVGIAASAASVIAMAGDEVLIARAGFVMIHNVWVMAVGDRHALTEVAEWLAPFDATAIDIYAARTGLDDDEIGKMLDRETWIGGAAAIDQGFADEFLPADEVKQSARAEGGSLRAERQFDILAAKAGLTRSAARELRANLKGGKPGAASTGMQDAAVIAEVEDLLNTIRSL